MINAGPVETAGLHTSAEIMTSGMQTLQVPAPDHDTEHEQRWPNAVTPDQLNAGPQVPIEMIEAKVAPTPAGPAPDQLRRMAKEAI